MQRLMQKLSQPSLLKTASYINGQWQASTEQFAVLNPATEEVITKVADAGVDLVDKGHFSSNSSTTKVARAFS